MEIDVKPNLMIIKSGPLSEPDTEDDDFDFSSSVVKMKLEEPDTEDDFDLPPPPPPNKVIPTVKKERAAIMSEPDTEEDDFPIAPTLKGKEKEVVTDRKPPVPLRRSTSSNSIVRWVARKSWFLDR